MLAPLPDDLDVLEELTGKFDWIQAFVRNKAELDELLPNILSALNPNSMLWLTFPKGTSKMQTDLRRDKGWDSVQQADLKWIRLISIDEAWSAFALRPYKPGEARKSFR